jgi:putative ABC transport system permease protein
MIGVVLSAWYDVRTRPLRTLAAIAGMVAAVTALITVDAAGELSRRSQADYLSHQFGRAATLEVRLSTDAPGVRAEAADVVPRLLAAHGVTALSAVEPVRAIVVDGDHTQPAQALLVQPAYGAIRSVDVIAGTLPTRTFLVRHAAVSDSLAAALGYPASNLVGRPLRVVIAGTDANPDLRTAPAETVVVDAVTTASTPTIDHADVLVYGAPPAGAGTWLVRVAPTDVAEIRALVETLSRDHPAVAAALTVRRVDQDDILAPLLAQQAATGRVIALIALAVGGLGLLGVALAGVRERGRDFGVRRALGASRSAIFGSVLIETIINVLVAAVVAIPLSMLVIQLIPRQLVVALLPVPTDVGLPVTSTLRGIAAAALVGSLAGLLPAVRSATSSVRAALNG